MEEQEVKQLFFTHVRNAIIEENEPRILKSLFENYSKMLKKYNFKRCERTWLLKEILQKEFAPSVGFHNRFQKKNKVAIYLMFQKVVRTKREPSTFGQFLKIICLKMWPKSSKKKQINLLIWSSHYIPIN